MRRMRIILKVSNPEAGSLGAPYAVQIDQEGGSIGRLSGNDLVLPSESVSRQHAFIRYEKGGFFYHDESSNGTFVRNKDSLIKNKSFRLETGDILWIGGYELHVEIEDEMPDDVSPFSAYRGNVDAALREIMGEEENPPKVSIHRRDEQRRRHGPKEPFFPDKPSEKADEADDSENVDDTPPWSSVKENSENESSWPGNFNIEDLFKEPQSEANGDDETDGHSGEATSDAFDAPPLVSGDQRSTDAREPTPKQEVLTADEFVALFLRNAGIKDEDFPQDPRQLPEFAIFLGKVFKELVNGIYEVIGGRKEQKNQLRLLATCIQSDDNNPFKHARDLQEALKSLLSFNLSGFVKGDEAVRQSFEDIQHHQVALFAGVQAALGQAIEEFDPRRIRERKGGDARFIQKFNFLNDYKKVYPQICAEVKDDFFGGAFEAAYEEQIRTLRGQPDRKQDG